MRIRHEVLHFRHHSLLVPRNFDMPPSVDTLYMPALVAMKYNLDLKAKYEALRAAGKPAKVAIMRKLIEMANALVKADRTWTPKTA